MSFLQAHSCGGEGEADGGGEGEADGGEGEADGGGDGDVDGGGDGGGGHCGWHRTLGGCSGGGDTWKPNDGRLELPTHGLPHVPGEQRCRYSSFVSAKLASPGRDDGYSSAFTGSESWSGASYKSQSQ